MGATPSRADYGLWTMCVVDVVWMWGVDVDVVHA
jgi:hypothetical protein